MDELARQLVVLPWHVDEEDSIAANQGRLFRSAGFPVGPRPDRRFAGRRRRGRHGPALPGAKGREAGPAAGADRAAESTAEAEPFDLSYIPSDAMGVVAFRPSSVFGRPGLKMQAAAADKQIADLCKFFGLPRAIGLSVGQIAQVYAPFRITTDKTRKEGQSDIRFGVPLVIRSVKDFDWAKELKGLVPGVTEARSGGRLLYKLPGEWPLDPGPGKGSFGYFIPDGRTVVFDTEAGLRRLMEGKPGGAPPGPRSSSASGVGWGQSCSTTGAAPGAANLPSGTSRSRTSPRSLSTLLG